MSRFANLLTTFAVAGLVLAGAVVSAQVEKAAPKAAVKEVMKKAVGVPTVIIVGDENDPRLKMRREAYQKQRQARIEALMEAQKNGLLKPFGEVANVAQAKALADNFRRQFHPLVRAQLHVIKTVCATTREEQSKLAHDGEAILEEATKKAVQMQLGMQGGMRIRVGATVTGPRDSIRDGLLQAIKTHLPADRAKRYQTEVDAQADEQLRITARNLVALLDEKLILSNEQREKLSESLAKSNDYAVKYFEGTYYQGHYLPAISDDFVIPFLSPSQVKIWQGAQKINIGPNVSASGSFSGLQLSPDDLAEYDEPAATKPASPAVAK